MTEIAARLRTLAPSALEEYEDKIVIRHLYIERRLVPLNIYLDDALARNDSEGGARCARIRQRDSRAGNGEYLSR